MTSVSNYIKTDMMTSVSKDGQPECGQRHPARMWPKTPSLIMWPKKLSPIMWPKKLSSIMWPKKLSPIMWPKTPIPDVAKYTHPGSGQRHPASPNVAKDTRPSPNVAKDTQPECGQKH